MAVTHWNVQKQMVLAYDIFNKRVSLKIYILIGIRWNAFLSKTRDGWDIDKADFVYGYLVWIWVQLASINCVAFHSDAKSRLDP